MMKLHLQSIMSMGTRVPSADNELRVREMAHKDRQVRGIYNFICFVYRLYPDKNGVSMRRPSQ